MAVDHWYGTACLWTDGKIILPKDLHLVLIRWIYQKLSYAITLIRIDRSVLSHAVHRGAKLTKKPIRWHLSQPNITNSSYLKVRIIPILTDLVSIRRLKQRRDV